MPSKIEWTDETWNPTTGCDKVSAGCKYCYAERIAKQYWGARKFTDLQLHPERLGIPLGWKKPRRIFVDSMSDLFHPDVPDEFIDKVFRIMISLPRHIFQILTKRPERMNKYLFRLMELPLGTPIDCDIFDLWRGYYGQVLDERPTWPLPNICLGVSVENQAAADERIPWLLRTPASVRFVSYEPALGPVDFRHINNKGAFDWYDALNNLNPVDHTEFEFVPRVDWIIAGCESGTGARPARQDWFRSVRDQCVGAGVPFFLKQMIVKGKMVKMPELDGKVWEEYPDDQKK